MSTNKYDAIRALQKLDEDRAAGLISDTARLPALQPPAEDSADPDQLPMFLRRQAD